MLRGLQRVHNDFVDGRKEAVGLHSGQNQASATSLTILPVKVKAKGTDQMIQTYAFLDNGSNTSFCSEELANQLNLSGKRTTLSLMTMEREKSKTDCRVHKTKPARYYRKCCKSVGCSKVAISLRSEDSQYRCRR